MSQSSRRVSPSRKLPKLALLLLLAGLLPGAGSGARPPARYAFVGVNVLPMTSDAVVPDQTVVVEDGRIVAIGSRLELEDDVTRIDGAGRYLMPGVTEMHGHYPQEADGQFARDVLFLYVANGVTLVRGMQGGPQHLPLKAAIERGEVLGPRLWVSAPMLHGRSVTAVDQAVALVRDAAATGFDHLKVHEELTAEVYDAIARTADEVGLPFSGHVSNYVGLYAALEKGQQTIDHLDNYLEAMVEDRDAVATLGLFDLGRLAADIDDRKIDEVVAATVRAGAGVVPTMALWEILFGSRTGAEWRARRPEVAYMPAELVQQWTARTDESVAQFGQDPQAIANILALRRRVLKALFDAGVPVLLGTDSPQIFSVPGFSIHHEMALMVEAGLSPFQVLHAGTRAVAEFYGATEEYGSVAIGRRADLVLLGSNPLRDIRNFADTVGVMVHGRWLPRREIDERLAEIRSRVQ